MAKKEEAKELKCKNCIWFNGECNHKNNIGVLIEYRKQSKIYVEKAEKLEKNCKNFEKLDVIEY